MAQKLLLKDLLFNRAKVEQIATALHALHRTFQAEAFVQDVIRKFPNLELKARIAWIAECLTHHLPSHYRRALCIILRSLPAPANPNLSDDDFGDFIYASYADFVARNGCAKQDLQVSLNALHDLTMRFSAEDAIRSFINAFPDETMHALFKWSTDRHYHVRRLCSEGTRPTLPWSKRIAIPVTAPIPILDNLFSDPTRFVTRSVANHVNDLSKIDPGLAITTLTRWKQSGKQTPKEMNFIIRHALRTLIKEGHPKALRLLGVSPKPNVRISDFTVPKQVQMNRTLEFSFTLRAEQSANIIADYAISFQNHSGRLNSRKVFKLKTLRFSKAGRITLTKCHLLREHMATRTLYRGRHELEIQINGNRCGKKPFWLI